MPNTTTDAACGALLLLLGCSPPDPSGGGGPSDSDGADPDSGDGDSTGDEALQCDEPNAFSGPTLRDCDLPGACGACMEEKACASFLFRCAHDAGCVCMAQCVAQSGVSGAQACLGECALPENPPGFDEWLKGAADMCWDEGCGVLEPQPGEQTPPVGESPGAGTDVDCALDPSLRYDPCGDVLQLQSADGSLCARIERRNDGPGNDANTSWTLLDARVGPLGQVCHIAEPTQMCWFSSHHNFAEWLHIGCGALHYDLNIGQGCGKFKHPESTFRLHVSQGTPQGGASGETCAPTADGICPLVPPMDLFPVP